ncbi:hypothetical protein JZ751_015560 [Albula glossodonta]|uniref:Secreted protein n=1 Tax=Albula glossodonta TaxID=121402 RepID=A0A8T2N6S8_9TELE|nr:hypothetical protein JZ751_015560 [Albula glossodonta]
MNLFVSFILRAISVFIKDGVLYAEEDSDHCFVHTLISLLRLTAPHRHHGDPPDASATPLCRASGADPPFAISEWVVGGGCGGGGGQGQQGSDWSTRFTLCRS